MALQTSGLISLNQIHVEAGGSSGTQASINDSDIRGLINKGSGATSSFSNFYGASAQTVEVYSSYLNQGLYNAPFKSQPSKVSWYAYPNGNSLSSTNGFNRYNWLKYKDFRNSNIDSASTEEVLSVWAKDNGEVELRWMRQGLAGQPDAWSDRNASANSNFISLRIEMGGTNSYNNIINNVYTPSQYVKFLENQNQYAKDDPMFPSVVLIFQARSNINNAVSGSASSIKNVRLTVTKS